MTLQTTQEEGSQFKQLSWVSFPRGQGWVEWWELIKDPISVEKSY